MQRSVFAVCATLGLLIPSVAQEGSWLTDFEVAKATAKKEGKPILADFTGSDWCGWCIRLKEEVFSKEEFQKWAKKNVVLLELDFPRKTEISDELKKQNRGLAKKYGVRGYPTVLFLDAEGEVLGKSGYLKGGPGPWIAAAEKAIGNADGEASAWVTNYKAALKQAKKEKKLILADFTGSDWCGWCIRLKEEVFSKEEFTEWAKDRFVLLELDFPRKKQLPDELKKQNAELAKEHSIRGYPTILFLNARGKKVGKSGYVKGGPTAWIEAAEKELGSKLKKSKKNK
tara:strand:+ start:1853 stop:2707 length:855 start_codon:yes stop_codon:yes gene_type:complete